MSVITFKPNEVEPLVDYIGFLTKDVRTRSGFMNKGLYRLGEVLQKQCCTSVRLNNSDRYLLGSLVERHSEEIWSLAEAPNMNEFLSKLNILESKPKSVTVPDQLQREMVRETEYILPEILKCLELCFSDIMPSPPWVPGLKLSFREDRTTTSFGWRNSGFYKNGGLSIALYPIVDWLGTASEYFIEPKAYATDPEIGTFSVPHYSHAVRSAVARAMAGLIAQHAYKMEKDSYYRGKNGKGYRVIYKKLRTQLINPKLIDDGGIIGIDAKNLVSVASGI